MTDYLDAPHNMPRHSLNAKLARVHGLDTCTFVDERVTRPDGSKWCGFVNLYTSNKADALAVIAKWNTIARGMKESGFAYTYEAR
jgi:hypothetical protein